MESTAANCPPTQKKNASKNPVRTLYIADHKYDENLSEQMREKIDDPVNRELYSQRMKIIEPVFANIKHCKGMERLRTIGTMHRGEEKVNLQWQLYCIVHNIGKCIKPINEKFNAKRLKNRKNERNRAA